LTQVDHIRHAFADDKAELTVLHVVDRVGFVGDEHPFSNGIMPLRGIILITPGETGGKAK